MAAWTTSAACGVATWREECVCVCVVVVVWEGRRRHGYVGPSARAAWRRLERARPSRKMAARGGAAAARRGVRGGINVALAMTRIVLMHFALSSTEADILIRLAAWDITFCVLWMG